jgi:hypothetical protein
MRLFQSKTRSLVAQCSDFLLKVAQLVYFARLSMSTTFCKKISESMRFISLCSVAENTILITLSLGEQLRRAPLAQTVLCQSTAASSGCS